jgi:ADP-ribose pyrophosphatase YjhB (NUDIX family)
MKIATNGIIINESGQVLLIQRDDSRTFAPPGGSVDVGELPTDNIAREVREETGLIVMPVRLVGVYFAPAKPEGMLNFVFRCIQRGGEIATSEESPQVDFFWPKPLPQPMLALHRERLEHGLTHAGGPPYWGIHRQTLRFRLMSSWLKWVVYPRMNRKQEQMGGPSFVPPPQWQVTAVTIIQNENGEILWLKNGNSWHLPGGASQRLEAPWATAVRHTRQQINQATQLTNLTSVTVHPERPQLTMAFTAQAGQTTTSATDAASALSASVNGAAWFAPGDEPETSHPHHRQLVAEARDGGETAVFHLEAANW